MVDNHDKSLSKLDDVQRATLAPAMNERLRNDVDRAANYVRQQGVVEQKWQSEQLQKAAARDAVNHADDPDLFDHHMATGENDIVKQGRITNLPDKEIDRQIADYKSGVHAATIEALVPHDRDRAAGWHALHRDELKDSDKLRVEARLAVGSPDDVVAEPKRQSDEHAHMQPAASEGPMAQRLRMLAGGAPDRFEGIDLSPYRYLVAPDEYDMFQRLQRGYVLDGASGGDLRETSPLPEAAAANAGVHENASPLIGSFGLRPASFVVDTDGAGNAATDLSGDADDAIAGGDGQGSAEETSFGGPPDSPVPLRRGMTVPKKLADWMATEAPRNRYSIDVAPDFITQFRARHPEFVQLERQNFELSKIKPWFGHRVERTLLVYQSTTLPHRYHIVPIIGEQNITHFYYPGTKKLLPFGQFPEIEGFKLVIAEHTHPTDQNRSLADIFLGRRSAIRGPSNGDLAYAWLNPGVHFIIKSVFSYNSFAKSDDEEYFYGKGFNRQGYRQ